MGLTGNPVRGWQHSYPASVLYVHRHVQSQPALESFAVYIATDGPPSSHLGHHYVYYIAGDEADREKDYDAQ